MDCSYCPFSYRNHAQGRTHDFDFQIRSIKKILTSKSFTKSSFNKLIIYGGEPLIYFDQIKRVISQYRRLRGRGLVKICTNGILITDDIITYAKDNVVTFSINMDGNFATVRKIKSISKTEWDKLLSNLKKLLTEKIYFDFSTTLTPNFLGKFNAQMKFLLKLRPRMIGFNFLRDNFSQKRFKVADSGRYLRKAMSLVFKNKSKNFNRDKKLMAYKRNVQIADCICSGLGLTVLADGQYTTCGIFPSQKYRNVSDIKKALRENYTRLFSNERLNEKIRNLPTFGGGCAKLAGKDNDKFASYNAVESFNRFKYEKI